MKTENKSLETWGLKSPIKKEWRKMEKETKPKDLLDLMDWKAIESSAEAEILQARKNIVISNILLTNAKMFIKQLGGKTNEEINKKAKETTV